MAEQGDKTKIPQDLGPLLVRHQSRHLMVDVFECSYEGSDDNTLKHESFFQLQIRFEKLIRYAKFYIKAKQEKKVYPTLRQREMHRLHLIEEILRFNLYFDTTGDLYAYYDDHGKSDCRASELQPKVLLDTLRQACKNQDIKPYKTSQLAEDLARFYNEVFIPEGGVPLLQKRSSSYKFLWVRARVESNGVMFYFAWINLHLCQAPVDNNCINPDSEPTISIIWNISTRIGPFQDLVEFERFYDEKADGFKRHAKIDRQNKYLLECQAKESEAEELDQKDAVDTLEGAKAVENEGSLKQEKGQAIESRVDEFQETEDLTVCEGNGKELAMESADKFREKGDMEVQKYEIEEKELAAVSAVGELQGTRDIGLKSTTINQTMEPKVVKPRGRAAQKDRKTGRKGRKPPRCKKDVESLRSEEPPEIVQSKIGPTNGPQREDKNANPREMPKATPNQDSNKEKKQRSNENVESQHPEEPPENAQSNIGPTNGPPLEDKNTNPRKKPKATPNQNAKKKKKQRSNENAGSLHFEEPPENTQSNIGPANGPLLEDNNANPREKPKATPNQNDNKKKKQRSHGNVESQHPEEPPENAQSNIGPTNGPQLEDKNANPRKKPKAIPNQNANKKKKQRSNSSKRKAKK